jgi:hypothetical protein
MCTHSVLTERGTLMLWKSQLKVAIAGIVVLVIVVIIWLVSG